MISLIGKVLLVIGLMASSITGLACETFNTSRLEEQKAAWQNDLKQRSKSFVLKWLIGDVMPPKKAQNEANTQMNCLLRALSEQIKHDTSDLKIYSGYRGSRRQARIWDRKFTFSGRVFDRISTNARDLCHDLLKTSEKSWHPNREQHRTCWSERLSGSQRQQEILQVSSAPGISRHHWGVDFDIVDPQMNAERWVSHARYDQHYQWLVKNAANYGFILPYTSTVTRSGQGYAEERWHWSYYPIAQPLLLYAKAKRTDVGHALMKKWHDTQKYDYIKQHWDKYVFNVNEKPWF